MPQDAFTLKYLCEELHSLFKGGKVNRIVQPSDDEVVFTVYTGKRTEKLYISVSPSCPRITVTEEEKPSPLTAPNFCMLLRKHLLSAVITGISVVGFDRIVKIDFESSGEFSDSVVKSLYVELMGRYSNVILTENGMVKGENRGINFLDNGVRPLIVGKPYVFPPVGEKKLPSDISLQDYFKNADLKNLHNAVCAGVQGVADSTAKEIIYEYLKSNNLQSLDVANFDSGDFCHFLKDFLYNAKPEPCVIINDGKVTDMCVYPYKNLQGTVEKCDKIYLAENRFFKDKNFYREFKNKSDRLNAIVNSAEKKIKKRLSAISSREKDAMSAEENKLKGDLILCYVYMLKQGMERAELVDYNNGKTVVVELDKGLTPAKNGEMYYKKYNKQKRAVAALVPQREIAESELDYLGSVKDEIALAIDINDLNYITEELTSSGYIKEQTKIKQKKKEESFGRSYYINGFTIRVGRNNTENDKIVFSASSGDLWLHAKDYHSSHVIVESGKKDVPKNIVLVAAEICAYYSKGREGGKTEIVFTDRKYVKKPKGAKPGFVTYTDFKSLIAEPNSHKEYLKSN